jgi:hypothetical protein
MGLKNTYLHYAENKRDTNWYRNVANLVCSHGGCVNLLAGKNLDEIYQYATGKINMRPFVKDLKSEQRKIDIAKKEEAKLQGYEYHSNTEAPSNIFQPLGGLLSVKLNSFIQLIGKTGLECKVIATDELANEKIDRDIKFLKDRPQIQEVMQDFADRLGQGEVDAGSAKNSTIPIKEAPFGLDLSNPDDVDFFKQIVYKFKPSAAYEYALKKQFDIGRYSEIDLMEAKDAAWYGVQSNNTTFSTITGLGKLDYKYPGELYYPPSEYADKRDVPYAWASKSMTPTEFYDNFGHEFKGKKLDEILNGTSDKILGSYIAGNHPMKEKGVYDKIEDGDLNTYKLFVREIQFKTVDSILISTDENGYKRFATEDMQVDEKTYSVYVQNTERFYWLNNTDYFFGKEKLCYAYRTLGQEAFTTLSWNVYKSQEKSLVEQCIPECKAAQMAFIKVLHAIVNAAPDGMYIDTKYLRNQIKNLELDDTSAKEKMLESLDLIKERRIFLGDSEGFDGAMEGNFKPYQDIKGGLSNIDGLLGIIQRSQINISRYTGINEELAGMNNNPNLLNGARQSNITYGMNAINYAYVAKNSNYTPVYNVFAWYIKEAVEKGGKYKEAVEKFIGKERTCMIDGLDGLKDHSFYLKVKLGMRQEDIQQLNESINRMEQQGLLSRLERFIIDQTENITDAYLTLAKIEDKNKKELAIQRQQDYQQAQQLKSMEMQTLLNTEQLKTSGRKEVLSLSGEITAQLMQLTDSLGFSKEQREAVIKRQLQGDRLNSSAQKTDKQIQAKREMQLDEQTQSLI